VGWQRRIGRDFTPFLLAAIFLVVFAFPKGMPAGVYASALVFGSRTALAVLAVVLVYRSTRILNFAQVQLGAAGAVLFFEIVQHHTVVRTLNALCGCAGPPAHAHRWAVHLEYWGSIALAVAVSAALGAACYLVVLRRFRHAPPLVGAVATIAVGQALGYLASPSGIPRLFNARDLSGTATPPVDVSLHLAPSVLHLADLASLAVAGLAAAGLAAFLRRSRIGVAVRASAENPDRAATLGVDNTVVASVVWMIAGVLSGLAAVLSVMAAGGGALGASPSTLVRVLAAAVLAGLSSMALGVVAALALATLDLAFLWSFHNVLLVDAVIVAVLLLYLLARRNQRVGRVDPTGGTWRAAREVRPVPAELAHLPDVRRMRRTTATVVGAVVLALPFLTNAGDISSATVVLVYAVVGLSLLVLTGWAGLISLGQFSLAGVGAFTAALAGGRLHAPFLVVMVLAGVAGALAAVLIGLPALRIRGLYLAVTTLGFALVTTSVLLNERYGGRLLPSSVDRPSLLGLRTADDRAFYYVCLAVAALACAAVVGMRRSPAARALIAARDNEAAAQAFGVNLVRARLEVFALSGFLAALGGALFVYQQQGLAVGNFGVSVSLSVFLMAVIGGLGSIAGPILGAAFVGFMTTRFGDVSNLYTAVVLLAILLGAPGGLTQLVFAGRDTLLRRIAARHRIRVPSLVADTRADAYEDDGRAPIRAKTGVGDRPAFVPRVYRLERKPLKVPRVASTGKGAQ
jgi:branched-chain amino acid transport system permease protein